MKAKRRKARRISPDNRQSQKTTALQEQPQDPLKPILLIEKIEEKHEKKQPSKQKKASQNFSKEEENLLTLIANIIVEIVLREEL